MSNQEMNSDLISFVSQVNGEKNLRVEENFGEGFVRLRVGEAERRQAKHDIQSNEDIVIEMLRNARDAGAKHIFVTTAKDSTSRTIIMLDDGDGIPQSMHEKIFDARVTSKLETVHMDKWGIHGRGMALYSIKENTSFAQVMCSDSGLGSVIKIVSPLDKLSEKTDQSTWPQFGMNEEGLYTLVKGPHNIIRTCAEFALEERLQCQVYLGSMAEIISTIRSVIKPSVDSSELLFIDDFSSLPVLDRLIVSNDIKTLSKETAMMGFDLSERTLHRILARQISVIPSINQRLFKSDTDDRHESTVDLYKDRRGLKISKQDTEEFGLLMEQAFTYLSSKYFIQLKKDPKLTVNKNKITVTFELDKTD